MTLGKNLILTLDGTTIAASKSCKLGVSQRFIDACAPTDSRTLTKVPTTYDWDMSSDCLVATLVYADSILDMVTNGTRLLAQFYDTQLGLFRRGYVYVQNAEITGSIGSLATLSISLVGSGPLNKVDFSDISKTLYGGTRVDSVDQDQRGFSYSQAGLNGLYIAVERNDQFIRWDDGRRRDDLDYPVTDDEHPRSAHFKGGVDELYIVSGTLNGNVITPTMECRVSIPDIKPFPNHWFCISLVAYCTDYDDPQGNDFVEVCDIVVSKGEAPDE